MEEAVQPSIFIWMVPTLLALFAWGLGQGFVKKYISEVSPAQYCLYFVVAKAFVNIGYYFFYGAPAPFSEGAENVYGLGILAYLLDGTAWIFYFLSILAGPITIVGTLSAAYPAVAVLLGWGFLGETLHVVQYAAVALVIGGCIGLSYSPDGSETKVIQKRWVPYAVLAILLWGISQTIVRHAYTLPGASDANMALYNTIGGALTLGVYGLLFGRKAIHSTQGWFRSIVPMGLMASGDLFVIIALSAGPSSLVSPISGAYPVVTILFARFILKERILFFHWLCVATVILGLSLISAFAA